MPYTNLNENWHIARGQLEERFCNAMRHLEALHKEVADVGKVNSEQNEKLCQIEKRLDSICEVVKPIQGFVKTAIWIFGAVSAILGAVVAYKEFIGF